MPRDAIATSAEPPVVVAEGATDRILSEETKRAIGPSPPSNQGGLPNMDLKLLMLSCMVRLGCISNTVPGVEERLVPMPTVNCTKLSFRPARSVDCPSAFTLSARPVFLSPLVADISSTLKPLANPFSSRAADTLSSTLDRAESALVKSDKFLSALRPNFKYFVDILHPVLLNGSLSLFINTCSID